MKPEFLWGTSSPEDKLAGDLGNVIAQASSCGSLLQLPTEPGFPQSSCRFRPSRTVWRSNDDL
jgi:hypothetical protein